MTVPADVPPPSARLHPLLQQRFSPLSFDPDHALSDGEVDLLLEAARWAPSAGNSQPWAFLPARRGEERHERICRHLAASSLRWAPSAALLVVNVCQRRVAGTDWAASEFADYDLGQAVAHMTVQAAAMGLSCRQFRAFDLAALTTELSIAPEWSVLTLTAIGRAADAGAPGRERRSLDDLRSAASTKPVAPDFPRHP